MRIEEKRQLVVLLRKYQKELLEKDEANKSAKIDKRWNDVQSGIKAQYDHARIIANKLDVDITNNIDRGWY